MILRRAALLAVGDFVWLEVTASRVLWEVAQVQRIYGTGRGELDVVLTRHVGEPGQFAFRCFLDDLVAIMPQPLDERGRT